MILTAFRVVHYSLWMIHSTLAGLFAAVVRLGIGSLPTGMTWTQVIGIGLLAGSGFIVSLFIAGLAFEDGALVSDAKIGIFIGSVVAGLAGYAFLRTAGGAR